MKYPYGNYYMRAASATGALYPIELYVVCDDVSPNLVAGVYHFSPADFSLTQIRKGSYKRYLADAANNQDIARAPITIIFTSFAWRNAWKYQARSYRHWFWDSGVIAANLLATTRAMGLRPARARCAGDRRGAAPTGRPAAGPARRPPGRLGDAARDAGSRWEAGVCPRAAAGPSDPPPRCSPRQAIHPCRRRTRSTSRYAASGVRARRAGRRRRARSRGRRRPAGARGSCQPPSTSSPVLPPSTRSATPGRPWRSTPPEPTSRSTSRRSLPLRSTTRPSGLTTTCGPAGVPAQGEARPRRAAIASSSSRSAVGRRAGRPGPRAGVGGGAAAGSSSQAGLDAASTVVTARPAHAEVALDGAGDRRGGDDLAGQRRRPRGRARPPSARRWWRRRRRRRPRRRRPGARRRGRGRAARRR